MCQTQFEEEVFTLYSQAQHTLGTADMEYIVMNFCLHSAIKCMKNIVTNTLGVDLQV